MQGGGNMKFCARCNKQFNTPGNFCPQCGNKLSEIASVKFCPACGKKLTADAKFCDGCGTNVNNENASNGIAAQNNIPSMGEPKQKKSIIPVICIAVLLIAMLGGAGYYFSKKFDVSIAEYRNKVVQVFPEPFLKILGLEKNTEGEVKQGNNANSGSNQDAKFPNDNIQYNVQSPSNSGTTGVANSATPVNPPLTAQPANPPVNNALPSSSAPSVNGNGSLNQNSNGTVNARDTFISFHQAITNTQLRTAFEILSPDYQRFMKSYDHFASGYTTTLRSEVTDLKVLYEDNHSAAYEYTLKAVDREGNGQKVQYFAGKVKLIKLDGIWRIDSTEAKRL